MSNKYFDVIIIGGGFFGCKIAAYLHNHYTKILIIEKNPNLLERASTNNQARVHNGYHYPRSLLTAWRSHFNLPRFVKEYQEAIVNNFSSYYGIGKKFSQVNAKQFQGFCQRVSLPLVAAEGEITNLFNPHLVEAVFKTEEYVFDASKLSKIVTEELTEANISLQLNCEVVKIHSNTNTQLAVTYIDNHQQVSTVTSSYVFNCTYSNLNTVLANSRLNTIPLKHEFTEIALTQVTDTLKNLGITIVCGPFFSLLPFPIRNLHSFTHVRYTPHCYWQDHDDYSYLNEKIYQETPRQSRYYYMLKDAMRYLPILSECEYRESLWEIKTVLPQSETNDSRPILFKQDSQLPNLISVLGGKIDNIYDVFVELKQLLKFE